VAVRPDFAVTAATAPAVAGVCARLDGLPLALELAAARSTVLSPPALLARLGRRLETLTGGARDLPARQQTLRRTLDWSHDLLSPAEQTLFRRLGVFAGGCSLEAAEAVCPAPTVQAVDVLDGLASLVDKSLLRQEEDAAGGSWFLMLETIREFAEERLEASGEAAALRRQHAATYVALAEAAEPKLTSGEVDRWLDRLDRERDNLRAALAWSLSPAGEVEWGLRLAGALAWYWMRRGVMGEWRTWLEALLARADERPTLARAKALYAAGFATWAQADLPAARPLVEASIALFRSLGPPARRGLALALLLLGYQALSEGNPARGQAPLEESEALWRRLGDEWGLGYTFSGLAGVAAQRGDLPRAQRLHQEAIALYRRLGDRHAAAMVMFNLVPVLMQTGDLAGARRLAEESLASFRQRRDTWAMARLLNTLSVIARLEGDFAAAQALATQALALAREVGEKRAIANSLRSLGTLAQLQGDYQTADQRYQESLAGLREAGLDGVARDGLVQLGHLALHRGQPDRAAVLLRQALSGGEWTDERPRPAVLTAFGLAGIAGVVAPRQPERAARLLGAAEAVLQRRGYRQGPLERVQLDWSQAAVRGALGDAAFAAALADGRAMSLEQAVSYALEEPAAELAETGDG
jgi:predicted ATPase